MIKSPISIMFWMLWTVSVCFCAPQLSADRNRGVELDAIIQEVSEELKKDNPEIRREAGKEVVRVLSVVEGLIEEASAAASADDSAKELMAALDRIRNVSRVQLFLLGMDPAHRSKVEALSRSMPDLYDRIGSSDRKVREALVRELTTKAAPEAVPIFIEFLDDDDLQVRKYAVKGLGAIGGEQAIEPLLEFFRSLPSPTYSATERFMTEETYNLIELVIEALGRIGHKRATPALVRSLKAGPMFPGTASAIRALSEIGDPRALPSLMETLDNNRIRFNMRQSGKIYDLKEGDLAMEAVLKITNQPRSDYGMMAAGSMKPPAGIYEILFESEEARSRGIAKLKEWWKDNQHSFISDKDSREFAKEVAAQDLRLLSGSSGASKFTASLNRLRSHAESGDLDALLKEALKIMKTEPRLSLVARMELLSAYRRRNRLDELLESLLKELQADSKNASIYTILGEIYRAQGRPVKAIDMYEEAVKLNPKDAQMLSSLGSIYFSLREYEKTIDLLKRVGELSNGSFSHYAMLADSYVRLGRKDEAVKLADQVRQMIESRETPIAPAMANATLGDIYRAVGRYDEAVNALQKAIELAPAMEPMLKNRLAMVYERAGKPELAEKIRRDAIPEATRIGKDAIDFTLQDLSGKTVHISDFKGKTVLLDFWATWCAPCVVEIPKLEALHRKYKDKGLAVIGMNIESDHDKVKEFVKDKMSYLVLLDAEGKSKEYGVQGFPTKIYIDAEGKIRYRDLGFRPGQEIEIEEKIKKLLPENQDQ
jgi:tetratricopeptide (TPR) repeat protein